MGAEAKEGRVWPSLSMQLSQKALIRRLLCRSRPEARVYGEEGEWRLSQLAVPKAATEIDAYGW